MTSSPFDPAWAFLQNASVLESLDDLQDGFARAIGAFGFDRFSCTLISKPGGSPSPRVLFGRANRAWDQYYLEQGYMQLDPCVREIFNRPGPFSWTDIRDRPLTGDGQRVMDAASEAEAREGFVVPVRGADGEFYGVRMSSPERSFDQSARPTLHALATVYVHEGVKRLELIDDIDTHTPLSRRETECLSWVAAGKSDWDISEILRISEATVHTHIENAKRKIGVRSRVQAAVIATMRGWLIVNSPT